MNQVNYIDDLQSSELCLDENFQPNFSIKPRTKEPIFRKPGAKTKKVWHLGISLFKDWRLDSDDLLDKCFEFDWNTNKLQKFIKNEYDKEAIKKFLKSHYKQYKECYKQLSNQGEVWAIQQLAFQEFISKIKAIDNNILEADVNLKWVSTLSGNPKNPRMPERGLIRCQLMEVLVRISEEKFLKHGLTSSLYESVVKFINENCLEEFERHNQQKWRESIYWNEQNDDALKFFQPLIKHIYKLNANKKVKPGQKPFMCLEELTNICKNMDLIDENFVERDINLAFNLSQMTEIDEINQDKNSQLQYVEFLEALARIAEKASPAPFGLTNNDMPYHVRSKQPLHLRLEGLLIRLHSICDFHTQMAFKLPKKSIFDVVEEVAEDSD